MADDKPMTIKERMAALAKASGGGGAGPTPGPPLPGATPATGSTVAERLAKMRRGGSDPNRQKAPDLVRMSTPPASSNATSTEPESPASSQATGGSSIASRIAMLSSVGSASTSSSSALVPPSPSASSTLQPALGRTTSAASSTNESAESAAGGGQPTSESSTESPRVSPGLAARMQAMSFQSSATTTTASGGDTGEGSREKGGSFPPPPPGSSSSAVGAGGLSPSRVSRGITARMEALGGLNPGKVEGSDDASGSGKGAIRPQRIGGVGLPGMGRAIPLPGLMPPGGLKELQRRKLQEAGEKEEPASTADGGTESTAEQQQPGQLQHTVNLSRATMPQRRRPRKTAKPFKATPAAAAAVATSSVTPENSGGKAEKANTAETPVTAQKPVEAEKPVTLGSSVPVPAKNVPPVTVRSGAAEAPAKPEQEASTAAAEKEVSAAIRLANSLAAEESKGGDSEDEWED